MPSQPSPSPVEITLKRVTSESDIPTLAHLSDLALKPDGFHEFRRRYGAKSPYDDSVEKLTRAMRDDKGQYFMFKAMIKSKAAVDLELPEQPRHSEKEIIVGFSQWRIGYVETPKMDPFAPRRQVAHSGTFEAGVSNLAISEERNAEQADGVDLNDKQRMKAFYSNPNDELARKMGNVYIETIRAKRHVGK
ncbi:hypothetical protein A1O1_07621 [Capronia coronata CBS 617.96]|uniref:Uncharacterized protein n=1 Tax=Capronia coronata CBS 617.96 TaxID=1182541 RepID=W9XLZ6_9EURO|nr:uncharacterized protein A1O1_07621 [Capronia coronata CBS 617.96]EXJ81557.1 hypothetical protein A1O1_07621 [Capronia coronata CBS 617.96]